MIDESPAGAGRSSRPTCGYQAEQHTADVLVERSARTARRVTRSRAAVGAVYLLTVAGFIPILVALWAIVLERALVAVGTPDPLQVAQRAVAI